MAIGRGLLAEDLVTCMDLFPGHCRPVSLTVAFDPSFYVHGRDPFVAVNRIVTHEELSCCPGFCAKGYLALRDIG